MVGQSWDRATAPIVEAIVVDEGFEAAADVVLGDWLVALQTELTSLSSECDVPPAGLTLVDAEPGERSADPLLLSTTFNCPEGSSI